MIIACTEANSKTINPMDKELSPSRIHSIKQTNLREGDLLKVACLGKEA